VVRGEVPKASSTSAAAEYLPEGALICAPCTMSLTAISILQAA